MAFYGGIPLDFFDLGDEYDGLGSEYGEDVRTAPYNRDVDRISDMPEPILLHILSFLDMQKVITTRRLSKRWNPLWRFVPVLNFNMPLFEKRIYNNPNPPHPLQQFHNQPERESSTTRFARFIDKVLLYRPKDCDILKFYLSSPCLVQSDFEDWIKVVLSLHVQEINLDYNPPPPPPRPFMPGSSLQVAVPGIFRVNLSLPSYIFTAGVKVFRLHSDAAGIPPQINFGNQLQTLELHDSWFLPPNWYDPLAANLYGLPMGPVEVKLNCPVLENLIMRNCGYSDNLSIYAPQLRNLIVECSSRYRNSRCCLKVSAPALKSLLLKGALFMDYALTNLQSLVNADVEIDEPVDARVLIKLLNGLYNATTLKLSVHSVTSMDMVHRCFVPFHNLRRFKLIGLAEGSCANIIHNLLTSSPSISLETLDLGISQILSREKDFKELFQCISGLKSMKIHGVQGTESEFEFLEFVLKTAGVLETLTVTTDEMFSGNTSEDEQAAFYMRMYSSAKASSGAKILVRMPSPQARHQRSVRPVPNHFYNRLQPVPSHFYSYPHGN